MVVALWRRRNRCRTAMSVQTLRSRAASHIRIPALVRRDLLGDAAGRLALGQRRHREASPEPEARAAIGGSVSSSRRPRPTLAEPLQQRQPGLLRMLLLDRHRWPGGSRPAPASAGPRTSASAVPRTGDRSAAWRDEGLGRHRLVLLGPGRFVIREQCRLLRDRPHRDVTVGGRLHRRLGGRCAVRATAAAIAASAARSTAGRAGARQQSRATVHAGRRLRASGRARPGAGCRRAGARSDRRAGSPANRACWLRGRGRCGTSERGDRGLLDAGRDHRDADDAVERSRRRWRRR